LRRGSRSWSSTASTYGRHHLSRTPRPASRGPGRPRVQRVRAPGALRWAPSRLVRCWRASRPGRGSTSCTAAPSALCRPGRSPARAVGAPGVPDAPPPRSRGNRRTGQAVEPSPERASMRSRSAAAAVHDGDAATRAGTAMPRGSTPAPRASTQPSRTAGTSGAPGERGTGPQPHAEQPDRDRRPRQHRLPVHLRGGRRQHSVLRRRARPALRRPHVQPLRGRAGGLRLPHLHVLLTHSTTTPPQGAVPISRGRLLPRPAVRRATHRGSGVGIHLLHSRGPHPPETPSPREISGAPPRRPTAASAWAMRTLINGGALGITLRIARPGVAHGSGLGQHRWVVERGFAWLHAVKRLRTRYEHRADIHPYRPAPVGHGSVPRVSARPPRRRPRQVRVA
jgi:hypothetical protein